MSRQNDILEIKIGALGGGSISGESGKLIQQQLGEIVDSINNTASIQKKLAIKFNIDQSYLQKQIQEIANNINIKVKDVKIDTGGLVSTTNTTSSHVAKEISDNNKIQKQIDSKIRSYTKLTANIEEWNQRYGKIVSTNQQVHQGLEKVLASARELPKSNIEDLDKQYNDLRFTFDNLRNAASQTGAMALTMGQKFKKAIESKAFNNLAVLLLGVVTRAFRQVYQNVIKLDAAMTQLRIVTRASDKAYEDFSKSVASSAKRIGASIKDLIESTTEFARLGYNIKDAQVFAELTTIFSRVADVNIGEATNSITAVIKAYDIKASELRGVLDQFVAVADGFAISADEISYAMNNAGSALQANGNSLQEALGILTAANTTIQNINVSSTAVRTMAARISRSSAELADLGEDIGNVLTTSRLDAKMREFGVAITDANGELRSTYDILADVSKIWDTLGSTQRAAVAEMIAGTRLQNSFYSIISNWQDAEDIVNNAADGVGRLKDAEEIYLNSTEGKLAQLNATWESFSQNILSSDFVKFFVDILKGLSSVLNKIASFGGSLATWGVVAFAAVTIANKLIASIMGLIAAKSKEIIVTDQQILTEIQLAAANGITISTEKAKELAIIKATAAQEVQTAATKKARMAMVASLASMAALTLVMIAFTKTGRGTAQTGTIIASVILGIGAAIVLAVKMANTATKSFMASNPIGWILALVAALISLGTALYNAFRAPSIKELKEAAKQAKEAWEDVKTEIDEVNSKLEETQKRLEELNNIEKPTTFDKEEIDYLEKLNAELKLRAKLLEEEEIRKKNEASEAAEKAVEGIKSSNKKKNLLSGKETRYTDNQGEKQYISYDYINGIMGGRKRYSVEHQVEEILANWNNGVTEVQKKFVDDYYGNLREQLESLNPDTDTYKYIKQLEYRLGILGGAFNETWDAMLADEQYAKAKKVLADMVNSTNNLSNGMSGLLNNTDVQNFIKAFKTLGIEIQKDGEYTQEFLEALEKTFYIKPNFRLEELTHLDILDDTQKGFDALSKALGDISSIGIVSAANLKDVLDEYAGLEKYFMSTSQGFILAGGITEENLLYTYAAEQLSEYVGELEAVKRERDKVFASYSDGIARLEDLENADRGVEVAEKDLTTAIEAMAIQLRSAEIKKRTDELNAQKDTLKERLDAYKSLIDIRKDLLKTYKKEIDYQKQLAQKQKTVVDLETQLALAKMDTSAAGQARARELQSQLDEAKSELNNFTLEHAIGVLTDELDNQYDEYKKFINSETDRIVDAISELAKRVKVEFNMDNIKLSWLESQLNTAEANHSNAREKYEKLGEAFDEIDDPNKFSSEKYRELEAAGVELDQAGQRLNEINEELSNLRKALGIETHHEGANSGFVGGLPKLKSNEKFAKLLAGELVLTPRQMNNFMQNTLPTLSVGTSSGVNNYNAPLISLYCESITKDSLPEVKRMINQAVNSIKDEFDAGKRLSGKTRAISKFAQD